MKITSRHMSNNGELILKAMLSGGNFFRDERWSYNNRYDIDDCSAIIIDIDNHEGKRLWEKLELTGLGLIKVAYTLAPESWSKDSYLLKKPVRFVELNRLIENLSLLTKECSTKKPVHSKDFQKETTSSTVLELIVNSDKNKIVRLFWENKDALIDSERLLFSGSVSDEEIESLLIRNLSSVEFEYLENNIDLGNVLRDFSAPLTKVISQKFNNKLFSNLNDRGHFKLIRWPNFKRNRYNPAYVKIAVALSNKFYDMDSVSQLCKVSSENVIAFINISYALHNLEIESNGTATDEKHYDSKNYKTKKKKESAFLAKIRKRLRI